MIDSENMPVFTGDKLGVPVKAFVDNIKQAQANSCLSEDQVRDLLLNKSVNSAKAYMKKLVYSEMPVNLILNHLGANYARISPVDVENVLMKPKANKDHNLGTLVKDIQVLYNSAPGRQMDPLHVVSQDSILTLIRSLPFRSSKFLMNKYNRLSRTWKPDLSYLEFTRSITSVQRWRITKDIKRNGVAPSVGMSTSIFSKDHQTVPRCSKKICLNLVECTDTKHYASVTKDEFPILSQISCSDTHIIYSIHCRKCDQQYVGQTVRRICDRYSEHLNDILNRRTDRSVPNHFVNSPGHSIKDMIFCAFEKMHESSKALLDEREKFWIDKKMTLVNGLNRRY
jgi:hypothetical protein